MTAVGTGPAVAGAPTGAMGEPTGSVAARLPFYALMPEVRQALETMYFDTSAEHLLYDVSIYRRAIDLIGAERVLWASDFPLISQATALERTMNAGLSEEEFAAVAGGNAARLLGL